MRMKFLIPILVWASVARGLLIPELLRQPISIGTIRHQLTSLSKSATREGDSFPEENPSAGSSSVQYDCGLARQGVPCIGDRIINGTEACPKGKYSFATTVTNTLYGSFCGGSLINSDWVITAAHCISSREPANYQLTIGDHDIKQENDTPDVHSSKAKELWVHPDYSMVTVQNDIALIRLRTPVNFKKSTIRPVCLPSNDASMHDEQLELEDGADVTLVGWGYTQEGRNSKLSHTLQEASAKVISYEECKSFNANYQRSLKKNMLCVFNEDKGSRYCNGDSGGPLLSGNGTPGNPWILRGTVSWGVKFCWQAPSVTTDLSRYTDIIGKVTSVDGSRTAGVPAQFSG